MRGLDLRRHSIAIGLLLLLFAQLATSAAVKSPTFDEPLHVVHGYVDLATRDWRMQEEHPPLIHLLTGPLLFLLPNRPDPRSLVGWDPLVYLKLAKEVFLSFRASPDKLIFPSRVIVMGLTMLLGATLYRWQPSGTAHLEGCWAFSCMSSRQISWRMGGSSPPTWR